MSAGVTIESVRAWWARTRGWWALCALWLLYALPDGVRDGAFRPRSLRFSGDLLAVLTLTAVSYQIRWGKWVRPLLALFVVLLCVVRLDRVIFRQLMHEEPLLYDQLFLVQHLFVLLSDLWNATLALGVLGAVLTIAALTWVSGRLLKTAKELLGEARATRTLHVAYVAWLLALVGSVSDVIGLTKQPAVQWLSPRVADNVDESIATYKAVRRGFADSPYKGYDTIKLTKRPDVHFYIVESYGRVIWDDKALYRFWEPVLTRLEKRLTDAGVQCVSAFSTSTIRGGRSWLADGSLMMGVAIKYEAVFRQSLKYAKQQPNLISFLKRQGYHTVLVAPADRPRLGLVLENRYGYDQLVTFHELGYRGQPYGWGLVPDQYTIEFVRERVVAAARKPLFLNVHLVTSHTPWRHVPPIAEDWRTLQGGVSIDLSTPAPQKAFKSLAYRYDRVDSEVEGAPTRGRFARGYLRTLEYDMELLVSELVRETARERITVLVGDHQPPLITTEGSSYDTPVHACSRDPSLLDELRAQGFRPGLLLPRRLDAVLSHPGFFSLLARTLVAGAPGSSPLPPFLRTGRSLMPPQVKPLNQ